MTTKHDRESPAEKWNNTVLIAGDSMISNVDQRTLNHRFNMRVRSFPGATTDDMFDYLKPLLKKTPEKIILVTGTNDMNQKTLKKYLRGLKS